MCEFCDENNTEDFAPIFIACKETKLFWELFSQKWFAVTDTVIHLSDCEILFGILNFNCDDLLTHLNCNNCSELSGLFIVVKWIITEYSLETFYCN